MMGNVGAGSIFAYAQSAAMGGYGVATVNGITQAFATISGVATAWYNRSEVIIYSKWVSSTVRVS
jgi:hypothetical protein